MNLKSKLSVTKPLATIRSLVCIILISNIFQACETWEIDNEESKNTEIFSSGVFTDFIKEGLALNSEIALINKEVSERNKNGGEAKFFQVAAEFHFDNRVNSYIGAKEALNSKFPDRRNISLETMRTQMYRVINISDKCQNYLKNLDLSLNQGVRLKSGDYETVDINSTDDILQFSVDHYNSSDNEISGFIFEGGCVTAYYHDLNDVYESHTAPVTFSDGKMYVDGNRVIGHWHTHHPTLDTSTPSDEDLTNKAQLSYWGVFQFYIYWCGGQYPY